MAVQISYPGVYIEEKSSGIHSIEGVPTSITAFIGRARGGPLNDPVLVHGIVEFERAFGGPSPHSTLDVAVRLFFENGGRKALILRVGARSGRPITDADISAPSLEGKKRGLWALDNADLVNLLCIPPLADGTDIGAATRAAAIDWCRRRQALFIADPSVAWTTAAQAIAGLDACFPAKSSHAALFFPYLQVAGARGRKSSVAPCGAVAGVMARIDDTRGVWKAPAGLEATLSGVSGLTVKLTDNQTGKLGALGINCLRSFARSGPVVWGARTLAGANDMASEYKYLPVRRLALFIEESICRGIKWAVFEPNDEATWANIRLAAGAFLNNLFRQGAFQVGPARDSYFVRCDAGTTTRSDIDAGVVNIVVGFAPLKPAEFVIITIRQLCGTKKEP